MSKPKRFNMTFKAPPDSKVPIACLKTSLNSDKQLNRSWMETGIFTRRQKRYLRSDVRDHMWGVGDVKKTLLLEMNFQSDGKLVACFSTLLLKIKDTAPLDQIVPTIHQIVPRNHQILLRNHWIVPRDHQIVPSSIKLYLKTIKVNSNCTNKNIKLRTLYPIILTHLKIGFLFLVGKIMNYKRKSFVFKEYADLIFEAKMLIARG